MSSTITNYSHCVCAYPATPGCKCIAPGWHIEGGWDGMDSRCIDPNCEEPSHVEETE